MGKYSSTMAATANEDGVPEIELVHYRGFFRWLFRRPAKVELYVYVDSAWQNKITGKQVTNAKHDDIMDIFMYLAPIDWYYKYPRRKRRQP